MYLRLLKFVIRSTAMSYLSIQYYLFIFGIIVLYYCFPLKRRWIVLCLGSLCFYVLLLGGPSPGLFVFLYSIVASYIWGIVLRVVANRYGGRRKGETRSRRRFRKVLLGAAMATSVFPVFLKLDPGIIISISYPDWLFPVGVSFYSLQIMAYLIDIHRGIIDPETNLAKYVLFVSWFPQIVQGPIARFSDLEHQLIRGHRFSPWHVSRGIQLIIWGFFLKFMIADKAAVIVNTIFGEPNYYIGAYAWLGGILYSIQLYCDFLSCVAISQGVSGFFGITLSDNFWHPYFATTIQEFWRRWHFSLSSWLRDYVYIPLGGSRRGKVRKWVNLIITFAISGLWHGRGFKYLVWGVLHAVYQICGEFLNKQESSLDEAILGERTQRKYRIIPAFITFFFVMIGWIIFRADRLVTAFAMIRGMFTIWNPWVIVGDSLLELGLDRQDWMVLVLSIVVLALVSYMQEKMVIRDWIGHQSRTFRWLLYACAVLAILVFGTYGYGFNAQDFIYGGF